MTAFKKKYLDMLRVRGKLKTEAIVHGHRLCSQPSSSHCQPLCSPLGGEPTPAWGESEDGIIRTGVAFGIVTCMWGSWQNTQSPPGPHAKGLAGVLGTRPQVLGITAQVLAGFMGLKVYIYIANLGTRPLATLA